MSIIKLTDANGIQVNGIQLNDFVAVGGTYIPSIIAAPVGWYRIADIDWTGLSSPVYTSIFLMGSGYYAGSVPTAFSLVAYLGTYNANVPRITQLSGTTGNAYTQIRFSADGSIQHIDLYQSRSITGSTGRHTFLIGVNGGKLVLYQPTTPITDAPATTILTHTFAAIASGAVTTA